MARYQPSGRNAREIVGSVESAVRAGDLLPGALLPPVRGLAADLAVSAGTVAAAYRTLRQRGVVETAGRHGTRVRGRPPVGARSARRLAVPPGVRDLSTGSPDRRLLPKPGDWLWKLPYTQASYEDSAPVPALIDLASQRLRRDGVPLDSGTDLTVTSGALDGIERTLMAHLGPGDRVAVEDPGWANLLDLVAAVGLVPVPVAVDADGPEVGATKAALAAGARALLVTSRAQNPTGAAITPERATGLRAVLAEHPDVLVIEDDHAAELSDAPLAAVVGTTTSWAFVRSTSKPYGPDLRLAVLAGDGATVSRVAGRMRLGAGWVSTLLQQLVVAMWRDDRAADIVAHARASYRQRRDGLLTALAGHGVTAHGRTGINVWVPVPDETQVVTSLRDEGWAVAPGAMYRIASGPGVRITVSGLGVRDIAPLATAVAGAISPRLRHHGA